MASSSSNRPAAGAVRITPSDSDTFSVTRGINVESSGLVYADWENGATNVQVYIAAGGVFPANVTRIYSTGTTASGITVLY